MEAQERAVENGRGPASVESGEVLSFTYTNWRGETALRRVRAKGACFRFGATEWRPEPQWLLSAIDLDKMEGRDFAVRDIVFVPNPSPAAKDWVNWTVNDLAEGLAALHGEGVSDEYREKADHLLAHLSFCASAACSPAAKGGEAEARIAREEYPPGVTAMDHIAHDMRVGRFPERSTIAKFLADRATPSPQPTNTDALLSAAEQKSQGKRCACLGADEWCPCQNTPDRKTVIERREKSRA